MGYHYPGNVRELKNIIERLVVLSEDGIVGRDALPMPSTRNREENLLSNEEKGLKEIRKEIEQSHIEGVLKRYNNNMTKSAEILGISRRQLFNKIAEYKQDE